MRKEVKHDISITYKDYPVTSQITNNTAFYDIRALLCPGRRRRFW